MFSLPHLPGPLPNTTSAPCFFCSVASAISSCEVMEFGVGESRKSRGEWTTPARCWSDVSADLRVMSQYDINLPCCMHGNLRLHTPTLDHMSFCQVAEHQFQTADSYNIKLVVIEGGANRPKRNCST